jgi:hypothetical protein
MNTAVDQVATIRIELRDTDPPVWREVEVPTSITLKTLHAVIQAVFLWENYHLWEFSLGRRRYGPPSDDDWRDEPLVDAAKVRLADLIGPRKTTIDYLYDFGDSWEHRLTVANVRAADPLLAYPRYIGGERNGPPEDCGGIPGFYDKLDARADPDIPSTRRSRSGSAITTRRRSTRRRSSARSPASPLRDVARARRNRLRSSRSSPSPRRSRVSRRCT